MSVSRFTTKLLATALVFTILPGLRAADKDAKVVGNVTDANYKDGWIKIRVDGEEEETKYTYDQSKFDLPNKLHIFVVGRVEIVYKLNDDTRQVVTIKKVMPKVATGTVTGVVLYNHEWWVEVKPKNGPPEGYATHFNQKGKPTKEDVKALEKGDIVTIRYVTDFERHRIESLKKVGKEEKK
jgi:hypothetical protein